MSEYSGYTENAILSDMIANISSGLDTSEGSATRDVLSPAAAELAKAYINLDKSLNDVFPQTTTVDSVVDFWASLVGISRKQGSPATGTVTFTGTAGTSIMSGTQVQTNGGLIYHTTENATITSNSVDVPAESEDVGEKYNIPAGVIASMPISVSGVSLVTNAALTGGSDVESNSDLFARFLTVIQRPSTSGNVNDYYKWAMSVSGIGGAKIIPLWNGNGTVKIVLIDTDKQPASAELVSSVHDYIEQVRPIGASVTYKAADTLQTNISVTLSLADGYTTDSILPIIKAAVSNYLKDVAFSNNMGKKLPDIAQDYISLAKIGDAILNVDGVLDYSNLEINSGTANIEVPVESVAVLGTVTLS